MPTDAIPDAIPVVGFSADLGALAAAIAIVTAHIKDEHTRKAKETLRRWFGGESDGGDGEASAAAAG